MVPTVVQMYNGKQHNDSVWIVHTCTGRILFLGKPIGEYFPGGGVNKSIFGDFSMPSLIISKPFTFLSGIIALLKMSVMFLLVLLSCKIFTKLLSIPSILVKALSGGFEKPLSIIGSLIKWFSYPFSIKPTEGGCSSACNQVIPK